MVAIQPGEMAPDFQLPRDGGAQVGLSDFRGRKLVLFFYPKDDTSGCTAEAVAFSALEGEFNAANTAILGLSPDSVKKHDAFKAKHAITVPLASDEEKKILQDYGVWVEKSMYGKKYMGVERTTVLIDESGKIQRVWNKVSVPGHAEEVLEAARAETLS